MIVRAINNCDISPTKSEAIFHRVRQLQIRGYRKTEETCCVELKNVGFYLLIALKQSSQQ